MLYDSHVHSCHSPDSRQPFEEICTQALARGLQGIAITDHADVWCMERFGTLEKIAGSIAQAQAADARYGDRLRVFCGVELAEYQDAPAAGDQVLALTRYDVVLSSVHAVMFEDWNDFYSGVDFSPEAAPEDKVLRFLDAYFRKVLRMAKYDDFDVLTHLTCPLRYINGKYHRGLSWKPFADTIEQILEVLICREKALEVNTSGIGSFYGEYMPPREILEQYCRMGGRLITLGSDAHTADRLGSAFAETAAMLQEIGFPGYYYYEQRMPRFVPWEDR